MDHRLHRIAAVIAGAVAAAPAVSVADELAVRVAGVTPFSRAELEDALRLRLAPRHRVVVASGAAGITVTVDGRSRAVVLGDERGAEAARLVALVAAGLAIEGPPGDAAPDRLDGENGEDGVVSVRASQWSLAALVDAPFGGDTHPGTGVIAGFERGGRVRWTAAAGAEVRAVDAGPDERVRMMGLSMRAGIALAAGRHAAVGVSALALPFLTRGGSGDRGVLVGAGAAARVVVPLPSSDTGVWLQAGVDVMANRIEYRWDDTTVLSTGRVRPWLLLGVTWEGGP